MKDTVLITGSSSGLGKHLVDKFKSKGHKVIEHNGRKDHDLTILKDIYKLAMKAREYDVKILINNAAVTCPSIKLEDYSIELIQNMIDVNLKAPIMLSYLLIYELDNIININSMVGLEIKQPRTLYSATKWGLRGFSNSLKAENEKIEILDVYPTNIKTTPDRENAMDVQMVVDKIYDAYTSKETDLILDGRRL
jgi:short-subunit dehydrogenase